MYELKTNKLKIHNNNIAYSDFPDKKTHLF